MINQITPEELSQWQKEGRQFALLDIREPEEVSICSLGGLHIPLGELPDRLGELEREIPTVVYCHHGERSFFVTAQLSQAHGFRMVFNLAGGIESWACKMDQGMVRY